MERVVLIVFLLSLMCCKPQVTVEEDASFSRPFSDVLNYKGIPADSSDRSVFMFSDKGAWHGYALPDGQYTGSFIGPFLMTMHNGVWLSECLSELRIEDVETHEQIDLNNATILESSSYPDQLSQRIFIKDQDIEVISKLTFLSSRTAIIQMEIINLNEERDKQLRVSWYGKSMLNESSFLPVNEAVKITFKGRENAGLIHSNDPEVQITTTDTSYTLDLGSKRIAPGEKWSTSISHTFCFTDSEIERELPFIESAMKKPEDVFDNNTEIWDSKISKILDSLKPEYSSESYQRIAVKCLMTLNNNWRSKAGFLKHDGLFPSYNYKWFHGFWAWDSWKHSVAIAHYDVDLAKNQIKAMYDFQDEYGMIADCIYRDTIIENHNWRNTKPPLSGWAIWEVFKKSKDTVFLKELYPKLKKYHDWWYDYRDHNHNGLCEYGSTDGSLIAAKWESGMDNAVRFDDATIVKNNEVGWSLDMESVDLNAYLAAEKEYLGKIAETLNLEEESIFYFNAAEKLSDRIRDEFFHDKSGWFYDIKAQDGSFLQQYAAEGWIPLWTRIASRDQAFQVADIMLDSSHFNTFIPFPTLASSNPKFKPYRGYWRGPVWLDQVYFAIKGLEYYGLRDEANALTHKVLNNLEGLKDDDGPIWENYHPYSGKGMESRHFSWSAAHILLLMVEE